MSLCPAQNQKKVLGKIARLKTVASIEEISNIIESELPTFTIEKALAQFDSDTKEKLIKVLTKANYTFSKDSSTPTVIVTKKVNNISSDFLSPEVTDLFSGAPGAEKYFNREVKLLLGSAILLGQSNSYTHILDNAGLNKSIKYFKNTQFNKILEYLNTLSKLPKSRASYKSLYNSNGKLNPDSDFKEVILTLNAVLEDSYGTSINHNGKRIINIPNDINIYRQILDVYNAAVMLVNFDNILDKYFSKLVDIDLSVFNSLEDSEVNPNKYTKKTEGLFTEYWSQESHESDSVETHSDDLTKLVIGLIPHYDKNGVKQQDTLEPRDLYSLGALIKQFELKNYSELLKIKDWVPFSINPVKALRFYLNKFTEDAKNNYASSLYADKDTIKLRQNVVQSLNKFYETIKFKEQHSENAVFSILAHVMNNTYSAKYPIYKIGKNSTIEILDLNNHNAERIAAQNSTFSHLLGKTGLPETFYIGDKTIKGRKTAHNIKELEELAKISLSDAGLSTFINNILGIKLSIKSVKTLRENPNWGKDTAINLQNILKAIRDNNILEKIERSSIEDSSDTIDASASKSKIIRPLTKERAYQDILDVYMDTQITRAITTTKTLEGNSVPTFKIVNLSYLDLELLYRRKQLEDTGNYSYKNILLETGAILGTASKLEVQNGDISNAAFKWGTLENFTANFVYDFLHSFKGESEIDSISVMIGNYSDKNHIIGKLFNKNVVYNNKNIIGNRLNFDSVMDTEEVIKLFRDQSFAYYDDLIKKELFPTYEKLGVNIIEDNEIESFKNINTFLNKYSKNGLLKFLRGKQINLTEELHYSEYFQEKGSPRLALNQSIIDFYQILKNDTLFNTFVDFQRKSLGNSLQKLRKGENKLFTDTDLKSLGDKEEFKKIIQTIGIKPSKYTTFNNNHHIFSASGILNPILDKWLWTNNFLRQEYLFISVKPDYMHPHKLKSKLLYRGDNVLDLTNTDEFFSEFYKELNGRLPNMSKRNVSLTSSIELPLKKTRVGEPDKVNVAVLQDRRSNVHNTSGISASQEIHDGSSMIPYTYSKMIEASYPGKNYKDTKKRFATFMSPFGSAVKKDAESILSNQAIRNSKNSPVSLRNKQKQIYGYFSFDDLTFDQPFTNETSLYTYINGQHVKISGYSLKTDENKETFLTLSFSKEIDKVWKASHLSPPIKINNLFDIWEAVGGEYSTDKFGNLNEGSNDFLYKLMTTLRFLPDGKQSQFSGEYSLKDKMIHVISNHSAFKSGATNLNPAEAWEDDLVLGFTTYDNDFAGPQLDAGHEADGSTIKEVTQVLSALSQNSRVAAKADRVYANIAHIIEESLKPYKEHLLEDIKDVAKYYSSKLFKALQNATIPGLGKIVAETFNSSDSLPFSHPYFFTTFVRDMVSNMNADFIRRPYKGLAAILLPSHDIIQILEKEDGTIFTQEDIIKDALKNYKPILGVIKSNDQIVKEYLAEKFNSTTQTSVEEVIPGDNVLVKSEVIQDGITTEIWESVETNTIEDYYRFKKLYKGKMVRKDSSKPRNLRPTIMKYSGTNFYDSDPVRLLHVLNLKKDSNDNAKIFEFEYTLLEKLQQYLDENFVENARDIRKFLAKWNKRNTELLDIRRIIPNITDINIDFKAFFGENAEIIFNNFEDALLKFTPKAENIVVHNIEEVTNYSFSPAELMLPNIYKKVFGVGNASIADIETQKEKFFENFLSQQFETTEEKADFIIKIPGNNSVIVKYTDDVQKITKASYSRIQVIKQNEQGKLVDKKVRLDAQGNVLYEIPKGAVVSIEEGFDYVYIPISEVNRTLDNIVIPSFEESMKRFLKSFKDNISSITPILTNKLLLKTNEGSDFDQNRVTLNLFRSVHNYNGQIPNSVDSTWFIENKENIVSQISRQMYASWQKSLEFIASRIPAQSMQSFMPMKNVGYIPGDSNSAYVSVWQIWIQGSDFDVDKVYLMGYSFNKSGQYENWTPITTYSTKDQLDVLEKFPIPSGKMTSFGGTLDLTDEFNLFKAEVWNKELTIQQLKAVRSALLKIEKSNLLKKDSNIVINDDFEDLKNSFLGILNRHNLSTDYLYKPEAIKNSIVAGIQDIISTPSSQLWANSPINIDMHNTAADDSKAIHGFVEETVSPYDNVSFFAMQERAAIGKQDVGIGANGLKVFFTVSNYFNYWINSGEFKNELLSISNKTFNKTFNINGKTFKINQLADVKTPTEYIQKLLKDYGLSEIIIEDKDAALTISGFVSGATDNAKELIMAKINAILDLASIHLYMYSLGFSASDVAIYMNSPFVKNISDKLQLNHFDGDYKKTSVFAIIDQLKRQKNQKEGDLVEIKTFEDIYGGAQEFKNLSSILKANQTMKANVFELSKFFANIESAMFAAEHASGFNLLNIRDFGKEHSKIPNYKDLNARDKALVNNIYNKNENLHTSEEHVEEVKQYIINTLMESKRIIVRDVNDYSKNKEVSLLGGQFDFRYFMQESNTQFTNDYKIKAINYYNLFKNTINIFDVIDKSPHFKAMIEGISMTHSVLGLTSKKYNVLFSVLKEVIREHSQSLKTTNTNLRQIMNNVAFPLRVEEYMLSRAILAIDKTVIKEWLETDPNLFKFTFNVNNLLRQAGITSINLYKNDEAKLFSEVSFSNKEASSDISSRLIKVTVTDETDTIIDLRSDTGIANFKVLVEQVMLPILSMSKKSNLAEKIKVSSVKNNMGKFANQLIPTSNITNLNNDYNFEKFQEILLSFDKVDTVIENELKIKNPQQTILSWKDILYIYNLVVNNLASGNKRLTSIFENYVRYNTSLDRSFINFYKKLDSKEINIFDDLTTDKINTLLFGTFHKAGNLGLIGKAGSITVKNGNYVINSTIDLRYNKAVEDYKRISTLTTTLKNKNLIINYKCD